MTPDDPRLTAYALNELNAEERAQVERELDAAPHLYDEVNEVMALGAALQDSFAAQPVVLARRPTAAVHQRKIVRMRRRNVVGIASAAITAAAACLTLAIWGLSKWKPEDASGLTKADKVISLDPAVAIAPMPAPEWTTSMTFGFDSDFESANYHVAGGGVDQGPPKLDSVQLDNSESLTALLRNATEDALPPSDDLPTLAENDYLPTVKLASSDVPVLSGRASYPWVRRWIGGDQGAAHLPPREAVRVEELVNAFPYDQPLDMQAGRISAGMRLVECPWSDDNLLLGILLRNTSKIDDIEVKARLQVSYAVIKEYRLLGFAQPTLQQAEVEIPRILPAGESQFVVYELRKRDGIRIREDQDLAKLRLRSRLSGRSWDDGVLVCKGGTRSWLSESEDFRFAALMSAFGEALREDDLARTERLDRVGRMADSLVNSSVKLTGPQREAVDLIHKAKDLSGR